MVFAWLKRFTPRSLYGRAALILLVPVLTIQLVVAVVFIQRHYEGITRQLTGILSGELTFVLQTVDAAPGPAQARAEAERSLAPLSVRPLLPAPSEGGGAGGDRRAVWDLSGRTMIQALHAQLPQLRLVDLTSDPRMVRLVLETRHGPLQLSVSRRRLAPAAPHQLLVLMVLTSAVITLISYLFLRNQLRPVKRLAEAAQAFGRGRVTPFRPSGATEMRALGLAFLDMRARIERMIEQRTLMLSGVSHDLRTPLTRMRLQLGMMAGPEVAALLRDLRDMERLIDSFLDFARGEGAEEPAPTDPAELARQAVEAAARDGGRVVLHRVEPGEPLPLRPLAVRRALDNLIGNALRHAGRAEVSVLAGERAVRLVVEDDGPGIPEAQREEAQRPFTRLDTARNQDQGPGVGLGLTIARDVARRHGGALRLSQSERLGGLKAELILAR